MSNKILITEEFLINNGFVKSTFFYAIGGGEDENDRTIYVKSGEVLTYDYTSKRWYRAKYSDLNYVEGFPYDEVVLWSDDL